MAWYHSAELLQTSYAKQGEQMETVDECFSFLAAFSSSSQKAGEAVAQFSITFLRFLMMKSVTTDLESGFCIWPALAPAYLSAGSGAGRPQRDVCMMSPRRGTFRRHRLQVELAAVRPRGVTISAVANVAQIERGQTLRWVAHWDTFPMRKETRYWRHAACGKSNTGVMKLK